MRIIKKIEIEGQEAIALFDTGALHTYIVRSLLKDVPLRQVLEPYRVALGGKSKRDNASETGYYVIRSALAKTVSELSLIHI